MNGIPKNKNAINDIIPIVTNMVFSLRKESLYQAIYDMNTK